MLRNAPWGAAAAKSGVQNRCGLRMSARSRLRRDIVWVLAAKFAALGALRLLFFSSPHQSAADAAAMGRHLARPAVIDRPTPASAGFTLEAIRD